MGRRGGPGVRCILSLSNWSMLVFHFITHCIVGFIRYHTGRYTLLDVESNTQCGVTSPTFPPRCLSAMLIILRMIILLMSKVPPGNADDVESDEKDGHY